MPRHLPRLALITLLLLAPPLAAQVPEGLSDLAQLGESQLFELPGQTLYNTDGEAVGEVIELAEDTVDGGHRIIVDSGSHGRVALPTEPLTIVAGQLIYDRPLDEAGLDALAADPSRYRPLSPRG